MAPRRSHTKSRKGCVHCKRRKVKCDEKSPSCFNCSRHGIPCSYAEPNHHPEGQRSTGSDRRKPKPIGSPRSPGDEFTGHDAGKLGTPNASNAASTPANNKFTATDDFLCLNITHRLTSLQSLPSFGLGDSEHGDGGKSLSKSGSGPIQRRLEVSASAQSPSPSIEDTWGLGLELMHHYSISTASTLSFRPELQHIFSSIVPRMAYGSSFLMHGILAVSAMHRAHILPVHRRAYYADLAVYHQTVGIQGFRAALSKLTSGDVDWKPCFCFANLVVLGMCWQPTGDLVDSDMTDTTRAGATPRALDFFVFMRGVPAVLHTRRSQLLHTALSPLLDAVAPAEVGLSTFDKTLARFSLLPPDIFEVLDEMAQFYESILNKNNKKEYLGAVDELRRGTCMMAMADTEPETSMALFIPHAIEDIVRLDILSGRPHAMIILAHMAVLLRALETRFWYLTGLAKSIFLFVDERLSMSPLHLDAVRWQRKHVFETYET